MLWYAVFVAAFVVAAVTIFLTIPVANRVGILDRPVGHKTHAVPVPYIGGFGAFIAFLLLLLAVSMVTDSAGMPTGYLLTLACCGAAMFFVGLTDDLWQVSYKVRLVLEVIAVVGMIYGAGVVLTDLGGLLPGMSLTLGLLAVPFTVFAITGVTNALNMIDGIDGLSGSVSFISFYALAWMAWVGGHDFGLLLSLSMAGASLGFLLFNFRFGSQRTARVYLGDNGSMILGFLLGWMFVDFSQGPDAVIAPVTALFLFALPLFDSVMAIIRRIWLGKSPFQPDRSHLHHMLLDAGASVETTVGLLAVFHLVMALIGIGAYYAGAPDSLMFGSFLLLFMGYGYVISRPWRFVPRMRRAMVRLGVPLAHGSGVFIGRFDRSDFSAVVATVGRVLGPGVHVRVFSETVPGTEREVLFLVAELGSRRLVRRIVNRLRRNLSMIGAYEVRQFVVRKSGNDRRHANHPIGQDRRGVDRRNQSQVRELTDLQLETPAALPPNAKRRALAA